MMKKKQVKSKGKKAPNLMSNLTDVIEPNLFDKAHQNMSKLKNHDYGEAVKDDPPPIEQSNQLPELNTALSEADLQSNTYIPPQKVRSMPSKFAPNQEIIKVPAKLPADKTLSRKELFSNYGMKGYYDLSKIPDIKSKIKENPQTPLNLRFYGVEQLTDAVFYLLSADTSTYENVKLIDLTGCHRVTDQGIMWMADAFPNLTQAYLIGLYQVTEAGLFYLVNKCTKLKDIAIKGTSVTILPRKIGSENIVIDTEGYPCISPELDILRNSKSTIMQAAAYSKPENEDIVKMVVLQTQKSSKKPSLVKYMKGDKSTEYQPLFHTNNISIGSRFKVNAIECDEVLCHLFLTKRTLFIFPVNSDTNTKEAVKKIFGYVSYISSKVSGAVFIIAGVDGKQAESSANLIAKEVKSLTDKTASFYKRKAEGDSKMILKGDQGKSLDDQEMFSRTLISNQRLLDVHIDSIQMDLSKPFSAGSEAGKKMETALQKVCEACPEVQELADPMFKYISSGNLEKMMGEGAASMESLKSSRVALLDLMAVMGRIICQRIIQDTDLSCSIPWLTKLVNVALTPPEGSKTLDTMSNLKEQTPYWDIDELKASLTKAGLSNVDNGLLLLSKLGIGISGTGFISYSNLSREPFIELDQFFPEYPDFQKKKELFYTSGYQIEFSTPVPSMLMQRLGNICSTIRKPAVIWEKGIILQEACVETLFHLMDQEKGDSSTLSLVTHTLKSNKSSVKDADIEQLVWNTLNTYKTVLKFILKESGLPYVRKFIGQKATIKEGIVELVSSHMMKVSEDGSQAMMLCSNCGSNPKATSLPWLLHSSLVLSTMKPSMVEVITKGEQTDEALQQQTISRFNGSVIHLEVNERVVLASGVRSGQQHGFKVMITSATGTKIEIGLGSQYIKKTKKFTEEIFLDVGKGSLSVRGISTQVKVVGNCNPSSLPTIGDTISFELTSSTENPKAAELTICRNSEKIGSLGVSDTTFLPFIQSTGDKAAFMVYPLYDYVETADELKVGMRLEALDRLNPSLMCAATIAEVYPDGKVLIHFDGWTNRYDYVAEPDSNDLHPIGWFAKNGLQTRSLRGQLQAPHGYHRSDFDWSRYCVQEIHQPPVPFTWFTEAQIQGTPSDELNGIIANFNLGKGDSSFAMPCIVLKNRPKVYEYSLLKKCVMSPELFSFFTNHNKFFCLLPTGLDYRTLRNPSIMALMDFSRQNVHVMCPGLKMELLHFVDSPGTKFIEDKSIEELAVYLQFCYKGILLQNETLPLHCTQLVQGFDKVKGKEGNSMMLKICFLYLTILEFLSHRNPNKEVKSPRVAIEIFNRAVKAKEYCNGILAGTDTNIKCRGHSMSMMTNKDLQEIPMDDFKQTYSFMTKLEFSNNHLEKLPQDFFRSFTALEILSVSNNKLTELPSGIDNLKDLGHLDISMNNIKSLPDEIGELQESLTYLDISDNPFNQIPKAINKLVNLEDLLAENIGVIKDLSVVTNLKKLVTLNVGKNKIAELPGGLHELPLTSLDLSGVPWVPVSTFQSYQAFTQTLNANNVTGAMTEEEKTSLFKAADADLSSNLTPEEVLSMNFNILFPMYPRFGEGNLNYPNSGGIPSVICEMKQLKRLILCYHGIQSVPDNIKNLTDLAELDLSFNPKLVSLSAELGSLSLKQLHLKDCMVLNTPPKEIVARGFMAVMGYLKRLRLGASPCKRTKLMMVGLGGAGKTSLVQSLMNKKYRAYMDADEPITDGIDIKTWQVPIQGDKDNLTYSVWDFAGQTVYYNTHQFFLSNRAVYLLLWNVRQGYEHAGLDFWLSSIACHAPKAPILVIGTHIDKVEKYKLPEDVLKTRYPQISGFHYVSAYTGDGVESLKTVIIQKTLEQKYMGEKIPEAWLTLEKKLIKYREEKNVDLLPLKNLANIGSECGIFDNTELVQAIQFLHDLGAVQFFNKDFLRDMVVIYPQWIIDVMACLVTVHEGAVKEGKLFLKDVSKVWADYPKELHPWLLRLTEEFDLTCPLGDEEASIVPCLLPDEEPNFNWPHANPEKNIRESIIIYKFQYLPAGLFNRAQVRLNQYSKGALIWKRGSFMKKNNHIALMLQTGDQEVIVRSQGFRPENFLFIVHEMIETLIMESYSGVNYDFMVPCLDCLNMNVKDPSMVGNNRVQRAMEMNVPFIQCDKFFHILSIQEVKDSMPSDKMSDMDSHLRNSVRELIDLTQETTVSVFFIYSTKNVPDLKDVEKMVSPGQIIEDLRKHGSFKVSYSDKPETSNMEALTLAVKSTDVVMIGMSDEFCDNAECKKLLLYIKDVLRLPVLLVLLGTSKRWQKGELNMSFGSEVYVDMQNIKRYEHKINELYDAIKKKADSNKKIGDDKNAKCFISYCWSNSHDAIEKGSRQVEGALGPWNGGDPREVKTFLESKDIKCWIDVEKVGGTGLFTSIADGLREAEVMVSFVSNEYVNSKNCVMEFRYALTTLRIPVILVVVGTGYEWERSEIGLLAVGHRCPKINLQYHNETGYLELLSLVQEKVKNTEHEAEAASSDNQRNVAFQEVLELTQRKFLRHITTSIISNDLQPYPCLFVVDFMSDMEREEWQKSDAERQKRTRPETARGTDRNGGGDRLSERDQKADANGEKSEKERESGNEELTEPIVEGKPYHSQYCFRLFCEHTQGWHVIPGIIPFPELEGSDEQQLIESSAPYLSRLLAIAKHSNIDLQCLTTPDGQIFTQRVEEIGVKSASDFKEEYLQLRETVMQEDKHKMCSHLSRCQVNGKMVWLCEEHKKASRSKTEERYNIDIPLPKDELPEDYVPPEMEPERKPVEKAEKKVPKIFNRRAESKSNRPPLNRQTSQACAVM